MTNCPPSLRGDLSKWLCEINTGVYVGNVSSRVRDAIWDRVCENLKNGQATLVFNTTNSGWISAPTTPAGRPLISRASS